MSRLVTGLFYERSEAERAIAELKAQGVAGEDIYLETEVTPTAEIGRKGGEVSWVGQERRYAGRETGVIIGLSVGCLAGLGFGMLGGAMSEWIRASEPGARGFGPLLASPLWGALAGAVIGVVMGCLVGTLVDYTLTRLGAGPPLPKQETLVTVSADEEKLSQVYAALFRARARHLHVSERAV